MTYLNLSHGVYRDSVATISPAYLFCFKHKRNIQFPAPLFLFRTLHQVSLLKLQRLYQDPTAFYIPSF
jgi:hypothetical protein